MPKYTLLLRRDWRPHNEIYTFHMKTQLIRNDGLEMIVSTIGGLRKYTEYDHMREGICALLDPLQLNYETMIYYDFTRKPGLEDWNEKHGLDGIVDDMSRATQQEGEAMHASIVERVLKEMGVS